LFTQKAWKRAYYPGFLLGQASVEEIVSFVHFCEIFGSAQLLELVLGLSGNYLLTGV
jgi:hypothetical protein